MKTIIQKELTVRWGMHIRTVQRHLREFGTPEPVKFTGLEPVFKLSDIVRLEKLRNKARSKNVAKCRKSKLQAIKKARGK